MPSADAMTTDHWDVHEYGPRDARHAALLLPGGLCSAMFYDEVIAEPSLADMRLIATTLPGHAGTPPLEDLSVEHLAAQAGALAARVGADVVVGHSMGANVALEMAAAHTFPGPIVLISPSFSRTDEAKVLRILDHLAVGFRHLPYALILKVIGGMLKGEVSDERAAVLGAEMGRNDPRVVRRGVRAYLRYLDDHGSLAPRLCSSGSRAWVAFGENGDVGLTADERTALEDCPAVTLVTVADTGHFMIGNRPERVAEMILAATRSSAGAVEQLQ